MILLTEESIFIKKEKFRRNGICKITENSEKFYNTQENS